MNNIAYGQFARTTLNQAAMHVNSNLSLLNNQLMALQEKMATGRAINRPSDDPFGTVLAMQYQAALEDKAQYRGNVTFASDMLAASDNALDEVGNIINDARVTGLGEIGATATRQTQEASSHVIDALLDEVVAMANSQFSGRYLFAGARSDSAPFVSVGTTIAFRGDLGKLYTQSDDSTQVDYNVTADAAFGAGLAQVEGFADLNPSVDADTDLRLMNNGSGVALGSIVVSDGTNSTTVDLSHAQTLGDVVDLINDAVPATTVCSIDSTGARLLITSTLGGADMTIAEAAAGTTAADLGILAETGVGAVVTGEDLDPALNIHTKLGLLDMTGGIDLSNGLTITNGDFTATVSLNGCGTLEDVLNRINGAGVYAEASIASDGRTLEVTSRLMGGELTIGENGGTTAADLGLRTTNLATRLADLNDGDGVGVVAGDDIWITCRSGEAVDVDLDGCVTIGDAIDAINNDSQNGGRVEARLASNGNGIELVDHTVDAGFVFSAGNLGESTAADDLDIGRAAGPGGDTFSGGDLYSVRSETVFSHLADLRDALLRGNNTGISRALEGLDGDGTRVLNARAIAGTRAQRMQALGERIDQEILGTRSLLSRTLDLDYATTVVQYTTLLAALEASLKAASTIVGLSLLDYL